MADQDEEEDVQRMRMNHSLLIGLKTTVEGLLATTSSNVWSTYGGLGRLCKDMERILHHRLKFIVEDYGNVVDYWPFVKGLRWLNPVMTPSIERIRKGQHQKGVSKGQIWLQESLQQHNLVTQLKVLVGNEQHLHRHYFDDAFLFCEQYFTAMCICLRAVEENNVSLLAEIDAKLLNYIPSVRHAHSGPHYSSSVPVGMVTDPGHGALSSSSPVPFQRPNRRLHHSSITEIVSPSTDSVLSASYEGGAPCTTASSTSPEEMRESARDSLRKVLGKSRSRSPTGPVSPDPTHRCHSFSLYDSLNTDPLLSVDFLQGSKSPGVSQENIAAEDENRLSEMGTRKSALRRCTSEVVVSKNRAGRRSSDILDSKIMEDNGEVFPPSKASTLKEKGVKDKVPRPSRVIFSDSETVEEVVKSATNKTKQGKIHHKRSRSDISGIKTASNEGQTEIGTSGRVTVREKSPVSHFDHVDYGGSGFFRRPVQGQSLIQYLSSQDFHTCADLDKENAHFAISEALIAAIETMKWNHLIGPQESLPEEVEGEESDEEIKQLRQRIRIRKRERLKEKARGFPAFSDGRTDTTPTTSHSKSTSSLSSPMESDDADSEESSVYEDKQIELSFNDDSQGTMTDLRKSGLSLSMASLYSDADLQKANILYERESSQMESGSYYSAESVAISLLKKFSEKQLPKASELQWLVTEQEAPQRLLPLPNSYPISPDDADGSAGQKAIRTRLRGNMEWAPPRPQIIFMVHPTPRRNSLLVKQNYRCAGCGMKVETGYAKRYRYCEYLGKYFCQCCHGNHTAYIPGRILKRWDFTKYYVSNFARDFLTKIENEPLFNVSDTNAMLYKKVKLLMHVRDWRTQMHHLKSLLSLCKHATSLSGEITKLPHHWLEDAHLYSISDLISVKSGVNGLMYSQLKHYTSASISHLESCPFCQCFGFICEVCRDQRDVIFPYQLQKVAICQGCKTCFHVKCFDPMKCPKCARIEARKRKLEEEEKIEDNEGEEPEDR